MILRSSTEFENERSGRVEYTFPDWRAHFFIWGLNLNKKIRRRKDDKRM